jgi:hypothetical protein
MFPVNLTGHAAPGKKELLQACLARNVAVVAMKPFGGGMLLQGARKLQVNRYLSGSGERTMTQAAPITPVQCLAYTLSQVGVQVAIPGCASLDQLASALAYEDASDAEKDFSDTVVGFDVTGECVYCNHCLPCPAYIDIGQTLRLLDLAEQEMTIELRAAYALLPTPASACIQCGSCESRCPFGVATVSRIEQAATLFG